MIKPDDRLFPLLTLATGACAPGGFDSLEGFGELGEGDDVADDADDADDVIEGPFELESAEFEDLDTLVLTFSHPLASFEGVDPGAFRISLGLSARYQGYYGALYDSSRYWDANYLGSYYGEDDSFRAITLAPGPADDQLRIDFAYPLDDYACTLIANDDAIVVVPPEAREAGLFVHHSPSPIPLRDTLGNDLPTIGPDWVLLPYDFMYINEFDFPHLDPKIEIPCP
ncbi:hypothetical protein ACNOYE_26400 [Nannocystaceae bacterium ST9]